MENCRIKSAAEKRRRHSTPIAASRMSMWLSPSPVLLRGDSHSPVRPAQRPRAKSVVSATDERVSR